MKVKTIVFLHIPKTGGSTVSNIIKRNFEEDECYICGSRGESQYQSNLNFISLDENQKRKYKFIAGHVELILLQSLPQEHFSFTFLRNPVDRMISMYYYILANEKHHLHEIVSKNRLSIKEFMAAKLWHELDNGMVRRLSGVRDLIPYGQCDSQLLESAKFNLLNNISFFGFLERFDESIFMLSKIVGLKDILYTKKNVTKKKPKRKDIDKDSIDAIVEYNKLDIELYNFARNHYRKYSQIAKDKFKQEYKIFLKVKNKFQNIYSKISR